jgi:endonuclease YncB( thermonuclease family)
MEKSLYSLSVAVALIILPTFNANLDTQRLFFQGQGKSSQALACGSSIELRPTNRSQELRRGASYSVCNYKFVFQNDGNVVLYNPSNRAVWATGTEHTDADLFAVQPDGNVVLYAKGRPIWATNTDGNYGAFFSIQVDGNLVVYDRSGRPKWASNTDGGRFSQVDASIAWLRRASGDSPYKVTRIFDGDTFEVSNIYSGRSDTVRFACIDTPEVTNEASATERQYGFRARNRLSQLTPRGTTVKLNTYTKDRLGRLISEVLAANQNVNLQLVQEGHAVLYPRYISTCSHNHTAYTNAEGSARRTRQDIWNQANPRTSNIPFPGCLSGRPNAPQQNSYECLGKE